MARRIHLDAFTHVRMIGNLEEGRTVPEFIFMDDNARPHQTLAVEELLESEDITRIDWPAYSPDLNPSNMCGSFGETYCSTLTSFGEHTTTQTDAD
ncbi:hypothetical protein TNCV_599121 [Trichonephila clavipes]|nr:hypothetical protein TNCV_599121 [Trichonephila clavipes]